MRVEHNDAVRIKTNTGDSTDTELICGRLRFDAAPSGLIAAMPAAIALNVNSARALDHMRNLIQMIEQELISPRAGARAVATDLSRALFVMMLREHFEQTEASATTLKLLGSPVCATTVNAIVRDPARDWTLDALADRAHVSRATLVRAFQKAAGMAAARLPCGGQVEPRATEPCYDEGISVTHLRRCRLQFRKRFRTTFQTAVRNLTGETPSEVTPGAHCLRWCSAHN